MRAVRVCSHEGCNAPAAGLHRKPSVCVIHHQFLQMQGNARSRGKRVPTMEELVAAIPTDMACPDCGKYQATCGGIYLGLYDTPEAAAMAYDAAAVERFGEFARPNFRSAQ